jgi:hypothetical protein
MPLFSTYNRIICLSGSFGAIVSGTLLINESFAIKKVSLFHRLYLITMQAHVGALPKQFAFLTHNTAFIPQFALNEYRKFSEE